MATGRVGPAGTVASDRAAGLVPLARTQPITPSRGFLSTIDHDSRPGTVAVGLISAAASVLALGAAGAAGATTAR